MRDYRKLACYHYRDTKLTACSAVFAVRFRRETVGAIVYTMPVLAIELRRMATGGVFAGLDNATRLALINKNIRCIGRVVIDPRFRGVGLAARRVRETMPRMDVPIIEAVAVMGLIHPFFEKSGMTAYKAKLSSRCVQMLDAFSLVGVEEHMLLEPGRVHHRLDRLGGGRKRFIEHQMSEFLRSYGKSRNLEPGPRRTEFVLSKLTERPAYYIWFNPKLKLITS
jgi:hypothetical protein